MMSSLLITFVSLAFTGVILCLVFYLVYVKIIKPSQQSKKLLQTGLPAKAKVLAINDTGVTVNDNPQAQLTLEVTPQSGMGPYQTVTRMIISRLQVPQFQPGAKLLVKYDPNNPMLVAIEGVEPA